MQCLVHQLKFYFKASVRLREVRQYPERSLLKPFNSMKEWLEAKNRPCQMKVGVLA